MRLRSLHLAKQHTQRVVAMVLLAPALIITFFWATSWNEVSLEQGILAFLLLAFPCWLYVDWQENGRYRLPLLALIAAMYWLFFALPLFWGESYIAEYRHLRPIPPEVITQTLEMAVGGMVFLWLGMKSRLLNSVAPRRLPDLVPGASSQVFLRCLLFSGIIGTYFENIAGSAGTFRQVVVIFQNAVPFVAFAILIRQYLQGRASSADKLLLAAFLTMRITFGLGSGWMGAALNIGLIFTLVYLAERRKMPLVLLSIIVPYVLFFQVGKGDFRGTFWNQATQASAWERAGFWVQASYSKWAAALDGAPGQTWADLASQSLSRTSLLGQASTVLEKTPSAVPFQYGRSYEYMLVTLIPRFLWTDKPSVSEANQFFQVAYGLTRERDLGGVSIACGMLAEGYMNFGWFGSFGIMFVLGVLLGLIQECFLRPDRGPLWQAVGLTLVLGLVVIEAQAAQYLGGIIQQILLVFVVFLPAISMIRKASARRTSLHGVPNLRGVGAARSRREAWFGERSLRPRSDP